MASSLPVESASDMAVETFGLGTYDSPQAGGEHGEDKNEQRKRKTLPDAGGPLDPFGPDRLLGYPTMESTASSFSPSDFDLSFGSESSRSASESLLPGDASRPPPGRKDTYINGQQPMSVAQSKLPDGGEVPRAGYYDHLFHYGFSDDGLWAVEDTGAFASGESIPGSHSESNDYKMDTLGPIQNAWSGFTIQDQNVPTGFPTDYLAENKNWPRSNASEKRMKKVATNINLVRELSEEFLKKFGRKDLVRRHVMSFLASRGEPQFLTSDVIRYIALDKNIFIKDVLDTFPVRKASSDNGIEALGAVRTALVELECSNVRKPSVAYELRRAASEITKAISVLQKIEETHAK